MQTFIHVPKTGGGTVAAVFGEAIRVTPHTPARHNVPRGEPCFSFVRCPWQRLASWFLYSVKPVGDMEVLQEKFGRWVWNAGLEMLPGTKVEQRTFRWLLCEDDLSILWPELRLYYFEEFEPEIRRLGRDLGLAVPEVLPRENPSPSGLSAAERLEILAPYRDELDPLLVTEADLCGYEVP